MVSRRVPRRRHVRKTKSGRTIVRRHSMTVRGRRKYQSKRDWVGYQRIKEKQRARWQYRSAETSGINAEVSVQNTADGSRTVAMFTDEDRNELETIIIGNDEQIKDVRAEHVEHTPDATIVITEADNDKLVIRRVSTPLDPMRPFERRNPRS